MKIPNLQIKFNLYLNLKTLNTQTNNMKSKKTIYFSSENDEIVKFKEKPITIDENYKYTNPNKIYKFFSWLSYYFFAVPFAFLTFKIIKRVKFHNKKLLNKYKNTGYFIYANHTNQFGDGFCPGLITFPKKTHIIVNPTNISTPIIGKLTKMWGAVPLPTTYKATKNFYSYLEKVLNKNNPILIYPEAHLWPYYTKIRNFSSASFRYPVKFNKPIFCFTTIYKSNKNKKPKVEIYIDGPFYPNLNLNEKQSQQQLRDLVYSKMQKRSELNNYEHINYVKKEKADD